MKKTGSGKSKKRKRQQRVSGRSDGSDDVAARANTCTGCTARIPLPLSSRLAGSSVDGAIVYGGGCCCGVPNSADVRKFRLYIVLVLVLSKLTDYKSTSTLCTVHMSTSTRTCTTIRLHVHALLMISDYLITITKITVHRSDPRVPLASSWWPACLRSRSRSLHNAFNLCIFWSYNSFRIRSRPVTSRYWNSRVVCDFNWRQPIRCRLSRRLFIGAHFLCKINFK